ncbi:MULTISPECIES: hypothetical protein, partial [unclassified Methanoculleus]|uniref:hypothetical protein n=1 Tax=unclassified Methanoculleus TaxID=2619537 RepID=UPI00316AE42E
MLTPSGSRLRRHRVLEEFCYHALAKMERPHLIRQKSMADREQKEMCTMGAPVPHDAILEE